MIETWPASYGARSWQSTERWWARTRSATRRRSMPPSGRTAILVVGWYLAVALWCVRAILPAFTTTIVTGPEVPPAWRPITVADQKLVVAVVTANARTLVRAPASVLDGPQCHPLRRALMLGQHELNEGMLGVVPHALSGDPVTTYN